MDELQRRIVLVTGASGILGRRVAARLVTYSPYHVIGLDEQRPTEAVVGLEFVQASVRDPMVADLMKARGVDTVCHLAFLELEQPQESAFEANVMGTSRLLCACFDTGVRKVVVKSSMDVYGACATNPAFLGEDHPLQGNRRYGYVRDMVEIETLCSGFRQHVPGLMMSILRFPSIIGPTVDTPMTRLLSETWMPTLLGFDPMMQLIHEEDVVGALVHAVLNDVPGVFNVAAKDVLPLNKIRALAGKRPVSLLHPLAYWALRLSGAGSRLTRRLPIDPDYLRFTCVGDLARMSRELGFEPRHSAEAAVREFAERTVRRT